MGFFGKLAAIGNAAYNEADKQYQITQKSEVMKRKAAVKSLQFAESLIKKAELIKANAAKAYPTPVPEPVKEMIMDSECIR